MSGSMRTPQDAQQWQTQSETTSNTVAQFYTQLVQLPGVLQQQATAADAPLQDEPLLGVVQQHPQLQEVHMQRQQHQQQRQGHHSSRGVEPPAQAVGQLPVHLAPVRFSSRTHLLDPNTGAVTLPPKAAAASSDAAGAATTSGKHPRKHHQHQQQQQRHHHHQQQQQQQQQAQQPMHPVAPAHIASTKRPIDRANLGYKLLSKAGWQEGQGLGASEQGIAAPLAVTHHRGNTGLGFSKQQQQQAPPPATTSAAAAADPSTAASGAAAAAAPVLGGKRVAALVAAELAAEDLDTKVKRHRQLQQQKAKEDRDKAIQSYIYRAFNDVDGPDSNPLLAKSHRLTATNPLLD